ncbi:MAG: SUMO ligase siz1 [Cirrosporium novae-zelandiae]|nr:MAG: SUMO ligase siz1 [Cirrosporium novae-zelandiae]
MASIGQPIDATTLVGKVKTLVNNDLKNVLRKESQAVSGAKAVLQQRVIKLIEEYARVGNVEAFNRLKTAVYYPRGTPDPASNGHLPPTTFAPSSYSNNYTQTFTMGGGPNYSTTTSSRTTQNYPHGKLAFKDSPFHTILQPLSTVAECKVRESTRDSAELKITLTQSAANQLSNPNLNMRAMVYCAADGSVDAYGKFDVTFPQQVELRVNMDEVKANLRGLKNKPGSTRPADITNYIRKKAGYENTVLLTYALTQKRFFLLVNLVQLHPVEELVDKLKSGKSIPKEQVLREMIAKSRDADIETTSTVMSLKCPLSASRINVPCRSIVCHHPQCFDAVSYLQLQEQAPTWLCPLCNKTAPFQTLHIDQYVDEILENTSPSTEQVTIEPNGRWSQGVKTESTPRPSPNDGSDDDLVEIQDVRVNTLKNEWTPSTSPLVRTPPYSSREQSISSASRSINGKRPASQIIDLTLSDDEEDPPRAIKRPYIQSSIINYSIPTRELPSNPSHRLQIPRQPPNQLDSSYRGFNS